jgi:HAD superfamily hydrolase (TIGR01509 family)
VLEAVVFDLDGVLIDSEPIWEDVRRGLVAERGGRWPEDAQRRLMGMSTPEWARYLSADLGVGLPPAEVAALVVDRMRERYAADLPLLPHAVETVVRLADRWPLGLASSSPPVLIETVLDASGLRSSFRAAMSTEQVARGKPAPDIYLAVAERLAVAPERCAAVEDSSNGLRSAAAAGLRVIAVPSPGYPPDQDALDLADRVLGGLAELTPEVLAAIAGP